MNYKYFLDHGPDMTHPLRETDLKIRTQLKRDAMPIVPLGPLPAYARA